MNKSSKSIAVLILIILLLLIGYFGVYGQWTSLGEARSAYDVTKTENDRLKKAEADLNAFLSLYNQNQDEAEKANKVLPLGDSDLPNLLDMYSRISAESGLLLRTINFNDAAFDPQNPPPPQTIQSVNMNIELSGTYEAFKEFLLRVQRNLRLSDIVQINVGIDQESGDSGRTLLFTLIIRTYYQAK